MTVVYPPTIVLPSIARIRSGACSQELSDALKYLRKLYNPDVRGSKILSRKRCYPDQDIEASYGGSQLKAAIEDTEDLDDLRSDSFERSYAIRWLTMFCSLAGTLVDTTTDEDSVPFESLVQNAAGLLAVCAGAASAGTISRNFSFERGNILVQLTDIPLDNHDYSSVGAQTWGGACVLSEMIVQAPDEFGLVAASPAPLRVLELGAGTGLVSLVVGKLIQRRMDDDPIPPCEIIATDYYPAVLGNLDHNIMNNFASFVTPSPVSISAHFLDWSQFSRQGSLPAAPPFDQPFDCILGADIVYEAEHALWIKSCVEQLLKKPLDFRRRRPGFHLVIPLRSTHAAESGTIERVFARADINSSDNHGGVLWDLQIFSKDFIVCDALGDVRSRRDRQGVVYAYYAIGWVKP